MGWRERDWARFSDDEWQAVYGASQPAPGTSSGADRTTAVVWGAVGIAVLAVGVVALLARPHSIEVVPAFQPVVHAPVVYAGPTARWRNSSGRLACTAQAANTELDVWVCTEWTMLRAGQQAAAARDPGGPCGVRHVDQRTGSWMCDSPHPPHPESLPPATPASAPVHGRLT